MSSLWMGACCRIFLWQSSGDSMMQCAVIEVAFRALKRCALFSQNCGTGKCNSRVLLTFKSIRQTDVQLTRSENKHCREQALTSQPRTILTRLSCRMILQALMFTKLAAPFETPGSWDDNITYQFTADPAYGDSSYPSGYRTLWSPTVSFVNRDHHRNHHISLSLLN